MGHLRRQRYIECCDHTKHIQRTEQYIMFSPGCSMVGVNKSHDSEKVKEESTIDLNRRKPY